MSLPPTLDSTPNDLASNGDSANQGSIGSITEHARIAVVEGSGPELSGVTGNLLRSRLKAVSVLFFSAFSIFMIGHIVSYKYEAESPFFMLVFHGLVIAIMAAMSALIYHRRTLSMTC